MDASVWGPPLWDSLFSICFRMTQNEASLRHCEDMMKRLRYTIPCKHCRRSYNEFVRKHPIIFESFGTPSKWLWKCKDNVNRKLQKPYKSYPDVEKRFTTFHSLTSETVILDLLVLMAMECDDDNAHHILSFASTVGHLVTPIFGPSFSSRLRICAGSKSAAKSVTADEVRQIFECMLSDYMLSHTGTGALSMHEGAMVSG
jgi:hypothetical protein